MGSNELLPGTLDMLVLKTLSRGANHGYGIAQRIQSISSDALKIGEGSLYPALQRLLVNEWVEAEWGVSENNRKAKFYHLTDLGRQELKASRQRWLRYVAAVSQVLEARA